MFFYVFFSSSTYFKQCFSMCFFVLLRTLNNVFLCVFLVLLRTLIDKIIICFFYVRHVGITMWLGFISNYLEGRVPMSNDVFLCQSIVVLVRVLVRVRWQQRDGDCTFARRTIRRGGVGAVTFVITFPLLPNPFGARRTFLRKRIEIRTWCHYGPVFLDPSVERSHVQLVITQAEVAPLLLSTQL